MRVPHSRENLRAKDLTEQLERRTEYPRGHGVVMKETSRQGRTGSQKAQSGHEGEEQSVEGQAVYRTYSFREGVCCRVPKWCEVVKRVAEQPGER